MNIKRMIKIHFNISNNLKLSKIALGRMISFTSSRFSYVISPSMLSSCILTFPYSNTFYGFKLEFLVLSKVLYHSLMNRWKKKFVYGYKK